MMLTVLKFQLPPCDVGNVGMPKGAEILHVGNQNDVICLWAKVDTGQPIESRTFRIAGTGHPLTLEGGEMTLGKYLGTVHIMGGAIVLHVFELDI